LFVAGGVLLGTAAAGKAGIRFYRLVKTGSAFTTPQSNYGSVYKGGFEKTMSRREAGLILGIR
jgi:hypothetical protein